MKRLWNEIIRRYDKLIDWREELIRRGQRQINTWLDEKPCWVQAIIFIPRFVSVTIFVGIIIFLCILSFICPDIAHNLILLAGALVGLHFVNRRTKAAEKDAKAAEKNARITEQGLMVDRLTRATENLSGEKTSIRLSGMFDLEKIARSYEEERGKIIQILSASVRTLVPIDNAQEKSKIQPQDQSESASAVIATLSRIAALYPDRKLFSCDLQKTDLRGVALFGADLSSFNLSSTNLVNVGLIGTNLTNAYLFFSNLSNAHLLSANLSDAYLGWADLSNARLDDADISNTEFKNVKGLTQEQIDKTFYRKGFPPRNLPDGLNPPEERTSDQEDEETDKDK